MPDAGPPSLPAVLTVLPNGYSSALIASTPTTIDHVIPAAARTNADVAAFRSLLA